MNFEVGKTKKFLSAFEKCGANNSMSDNVKIQVAYI